MNTQYHLLRFLANKKTSLIAVGLISISITHLQSSLPFNKHTYIGTGIAALSIPSGIAAFYFYKKAKGRKRYKRLALFCAGASAILLVGGSAYGTASLLIPEDEDAADRRATKKIRINTWKLFRQSQKSMRQITEIQGNLDNEEILFNLKDDYDSNRSFLMPKVIEKNKVFSNFDFLIKDIFGNLELFINQEGTNIEQQKTLRNQLLELSNMTKD